MTASIWNPQITVLSAAVLAAFAAPSGASLVGYNAGGVGAISRTIQAKFREYVSVTDYGAVGDGIVDDTAAIQLAINSSAGQALLFPKGNYKITAALSIITSGITLVGEQFGNVTLIQHTDNTPFIRIGDGTLINRVTRATLESLQCIPRAGAANWTSAYGIEARYAGFINILNCEVYGQDGPNYRIFGGILFDRVSFSNIYDSWIRGIKGNGIFTVGAAGNLTADIRIMNTYVLGFEGNATPYLRTSTDGTVWTAGTTQFLFSVNSGASGTLLAFSEDSTATTMPRYTELVYTSGTVTELYEYTGTFRNTKTLTYSGGTLESIG